MKKALVLLLIIMTLVILIACDHQNTTDIPDGATVISGSYFASDLPVGYYFSSDGFGQQYIGTAVYRIKYYITGSKICIENFSVEEGNTQIFDFLLGENYILIAGIKYNFVEDADISDYSFQSS